MMVARKAKVRKYLDNTGIDAAIKSKPEVVEVRHCSLGVTSKGFLCHKQAEKVIGVLSRNYILVIFVCVTSTREWGARDAVNFNGKRMREKE